MREYFEIIRTASAENRKKGDVYYEAHHIIPKSFGKKSNTVLLTPQEHYRVHKLLAEYWKGHSIYGKKMLWAFHRLAYDGTRQLTEEEFAQIRQDLRSLWTHEKSDTHKQKISEAMRGNSNNSSRVYKGMKSTMSNEGKQVLAQVRRLEQTGKRGSQAKATKGAVVYENVNGIKIEAENALILSELVKIPVSTISYRLRKSQNRFKKDFAIYYKEQ